MLHYIKEQAKYVEITGFRNVNFAKAEEFLKSNRKKTSPNAAIQFFNAELIATQDHLYFAVLNALQAFQNKTNISKNPAVETMLYASVQRQIQRAIQLCGIKPETKNIAVVVIGEDFGEVKDALAEFTDCVGVEPDEKVLELTAAKIKKIREAFQITDKELHAVTEGSNLKEALVNLVVERVALLATQL
jgi:KEOPS complex subunit Cgi121